MSLRTLARSLEVSPATLSQIENGRARLSPERLARIAAVLDVPVAEILRADPDAVVLPAAPDPVTPPWREYGPLDFDPVLHAALDEFLDVGYHGATVRGIAARAGLSVAGLYHYYAGKQQLLVRIMDYTMTDLLSRASAARDEGRDSVERFSLLVENLALFHTHRAALGFVGAAEKRSLDADNGHRIAGRRTAQQRMVDEAVADAVRAAAAAATARLFPGFPIDVPLDVNVSQDAGKHA